MQTSYKALFNLITLYLTRWPLVSGFQQSPAQYSRIEQDALKLAQEMSAEYWTVSSLTGGCFSTGK